MLLYIEVNVLNCSTYLLSVMKSLHFTFFQCWEFFFLRFCDYMNLWCLGALTHGLNAKQLCFISFEFWEAFSCLNDISQISLVLFALLKVKVRPTILSRIVQLSLGETSACVGISFLHPRPGRLRTRVNYFLANNRISLPNFYLSLECKQNVFLSCFFWICFFRYDFNRIVFIIPF